MGITVGGAVVISIAIAISVYCCRRRTVVEPLSSTPGSPTSSTNSRDYANRSVVKLERKSGSGSKDEYKRNYNYNVFDDGFGSLGLRRHPRENMPICLKLGSSRGSDVALGWNVALFVNYFKTMREKENNFYWLIFFVMKISICFANRFSLTKTII